MDLINIQNLIDEESDLKRKQIKCASNLIKYLSNKIGKKLNASEAFQLGKTMYDNDIFVHSMMKEIENIKLMQVKTTEFIEKLKLSNPIKSM